MGEILAESSRMYGRGWFDKIAQPRHCGRSWMLEAVAGSNRKREKLVRPEILASGKEHTQRRGNGNDEQQRPESFHRGCLLT